VVACSAGSHKWSCLFHPLVPPSDCLLLMVLVSLDVGCVGCDQCDVNRALPSLPATFSVNVEEDCSCLVSKATDAAVVCRATAVVSFSVREDGCCCSVSGYRSGSLFSVGEDGCCCSTVVCRATAVAAVVCRATAVMSFNVGEGGALVLCRSRCRHWQCHQFPSDSVCRCRRLVLY